MNWVTRELCSAKTGLGRKDPNFIEFKILSPKLIFFIGGLNWHGLNHFGRVKGKWKEKDTKFVESWNKIIVVALPSKLFLFITLHFGAASFLYKFIFSDSLSLSLLKNFCSVDSFLCHFLLFGTGLFYFPFRTLLATINSILLPSQIKIHFHF